MTDTLKRWVAERRRIAEAATPGPWSKWAIKNILEIAGQHERRAKEYEHAATFIADARNCMSILLQIVEMQDAALEQIWVGGVPHGVLATTEERFMRSLDAVREARAQVAALLKGKE